MFVGEQPGDQEDIIGRPFVGPAGQIMDRAMEEAGIDRRTVYVTNAVKHFKFTPRGKRRIHQTPEVPEIQACGFWLDVERAHVRPQLLVLMGGIRGACGAGPRRDDQPGAGPTDPAAGRATCLRHGSPVLSAAGARRRGKGSGIRRLRPRPEGDTIADGGGLARQPCPNREAASTAVSTVPHCHPGRCLRFQKEGA